MDALTQRRAFKLLYSVRGSIPLPHKVEASVALLRDLETIAKDAGVVTQHDRELWIAVKTEGAKLFVDESTGKVMVAPVNTDDFRPAPLTFDPSSKQWVGNEIDAGLVPVPGEETARTPAVLVLAELVVSFISKKGWPT